MKKVLVLPANKRLDEVISKGLVDPEIKWVKGSYDFIHFSFNGELKIFHKKTDLKEFDFVFLNSVWKTRDQAWAISLYLNKKGINHTKVEKSGSKLVDLVNFALNDIEMPETFFTNNKKNIDKNIRRIEKICDYPVILKPLRNSGGTGMKLANNRNELVEILDNLSKDSKYMFQSFIPNNFDWGVLVSNGKVVSAEKSYPKNGEFRNNACKGAKEEFVNVDDVPQEVKDMAINAGSALNLSWSRSDIVIDKKTKEPYLMEVNRFPGLTSGTSEIKAMRNYIKKRIDLE